MPWRRGWGLRRVPSPGRRLESVHDGALHNQDWAKITVSDFKATRPEGIDNLAPSDEAAANILKRGGYSRDRVDEILNSGHDFAPRQFTKGETMYGFDSSDYLGKDASSPYWMDEPGFRDVESRFKQGDTWDRQGVKNYLALPPGIDEEYADAMERIEKLEPLLRGFPGSNDTREGRMVYQLKWLRQEIESRRLPIPLIAVSRVASVAGDEQPQSNSRTSQPPRGHRGPAV